jgi:putative N6-adenine-specific DNA methylase
MVSAIHSCYAVTPPGVEALTASELAQLEIAPSALEPGGVGFQATTRQLYAANLELRTASRIVVRMAEFPARAFCELERKAKRVPWRAFVIPGTPVRFRVTSRKSKLYHLDAIAERLRNCVNGQRSTVGGKDPASDETEDDSDSEEQLFIVRVIRDIVTISADSSGALLHRRGYRLAGAKAPLRETLAAAVLLGAGYREGVPMVDPLCGSGTLPIEAALIGRRIAPGLRRRFAFEQWPGFDPAVWNELRSEATARIRPEAGAPIIGSDRDAGAIAAARGNAERAGVGEDVVFLEQPLSSVTPPARPGLLATNPPYGIRIGGDKDLRDLFARFGTLVRERWWGWTIAMISAGGMPEREMRMPFETRWETNNGGIPIRLLVSRPGARSGSG